MGFWDKFFKNKTTPSTAGTTSVASVSAKNSRKLPTTEEKAAFLKAAEDGNFKDLSQYIDTYGKNIVDVTDAEGKTAAMLSIRGGFSDCLYELIQAQADINYASPLKHTTLMIAANRGDLESLDLLITAGAKIDAQDNTNYTALMFAANEGHNHCVSRLLDEGADTTVTSRMMGHTAADCARSNNYPDTAHLIENWATQQYAKAITAETEALRNGIDKALRVSSKPLKLSAPKKAR